jgi:hypothetical protein
MKRRTQGVLLVGCLAVATVVALSAALPRSFDHHLCKIGLPTFIHLKWSWTGQSTPIFTPSERRSTIQSGWYQRFQGNRVDEMLWAVTVHCPEDDIAEHLPCAVGSVPMQMASDGPEVQLSKTSGLPLPKWWVLATVKRWPFIKSVHVETRLDLAAVLDFYRVELEKRGWTENVGAVVAPDRAVIAFTTPDGPALLRLLHQDDKTIADISLRKPAAANAAILSRPGQVKLMFGNNTDEEAVITIDAQTITLAPRAGRDLADDPDTGGKSPDAREIDLPPGKYEVTVRIASGATQNRQFEVAADETWGLLVGPIGVPLPVHLY